MRRALLAVVAALFAVTPALAATVSTPATASFAVTLSGVDQTGTFTLAMTVANTGGTAANGWNLTASASQFSTVGGKTLPVAAASITGVVDDPSCAGGGCNNPTNSVAWPIALGGTALKIYNAALTTGKGTNVETGTFNVAVPSNAFAGTYTNTLTITIATGP